MLQGCASNTKVYPQFKQASEGVGSLEETAAEMKHFKQRLRLGFSKRPVLEKREYFEL